MLILMPYSRRFRLKAMLVPAISYPSVYSTESGRLFWGAAAFQHPAFISIVKEPGEAAFEYQLFLEAVHGDAIASGSILQLVKDGSSERRSSCVLHGMPMYAKRSLVCSGASAMAVSSTCRCTRPLLRASLVAAARCSGLRGDAAASSSVWRGVVMR